MSTTKPAAPAGVAVDAVDRPLWNSNGTPSNAAAAMADAIKWLETIKPSDAQNRERLGACIAALKRFCAA